jgi:hypothetical protein
MHTLLLYPHPVSSSIVGTMYVEEEEEEREKISIRVTLHWWRTLSWHMII